MNATQVCDAVSAATHAAAFLAAIPASLILVVRGDRALRGYLLAYGVGLLLCFGASTLCHAESALGTTSRLLVMFDHMAIYVLIAGTYTPIVGALLPDRQRRLALTAIWLGAGVGIALNALCGPLPAWLATAFYLIMGWGGLWCYAALRPAMTHRELSLVPLGGIVYSVGAVFHVARTPVILPQVFGPHELFHVLVIVAASAHYAFIWRYASRRAPVPSVPRPMGSKRSRGRVGARMASGPSGR